jgi:hypothetical protein
MSYDADLTEDELSRMINNYRTYVDIQSAFATLPAHNAALLHYRLLSRNIRKLQLDLTYHREERRQAFSWLIRQTRFRETIHPIVVENRRHPSPMISPRRPSCRSPSTTSFRRSRSPEPITLSQALAHITTTFPRSTPSLSNTETDEEGSQSNPIKVDSFIPPTLPVRSTVITQLTNRRTRSIATPTICNMCSNFGHTTAECIWRGPIVCDYCREIGSHLQSNCPELRQDYNRYNPRSQHCIVCNQEGHTFDRCFTLLHAQ